MTNISAEAMEELKESYLRDMVKIKKASPSKLKELRNVLDNIVDYSTEDIKRIYKIIYKIIN